MLPRKNHSCNVCKKVFFSSKGLQQHQVIHTDQKPFVCNICSKAFRFKSNLFEHKSLHTGAHPFICQFCGKSCRLKGNLKKHLKTHLKAGDVFDLEKATKDMLAARNMAMQLAMGTDADVGGFTDFEPMPKQKSSRRRVRSLRIKKTADNSMRRAGSSSKSNYTVVGELQPQNLTTLLTQTTTANSNTTANNNTSGTVTLFIKTEPFTEGSPKQIKDFDLTATQRAMFKYISKHRHMSFEPKYDCTLCKFSSSKRQDLKNHMHKAHESCTLLCTVCLKGYTDEVEFKQHMSNHDKLREVMTMFSTPAIKDFVV